MQAITADTIIHYYRLYYADDLEAVTERSDAWQLVTYKSGLIQAKTRVQK